MIYEIVAGERSHRVEVERVDRFPAQQHPPGTAGEMQWNVCIDGQRFAVHTVQAGNSVSILIRDRSFEARVERLNDRLKIFLRGKTYDCAVRDPRSLRSRMLSAQGQPGEQKLTASMPGKVVRVLAQVGAAIAAGQGVLVIEAMKMQNEVRSPRDGIVQALYVREGANVNAGEALALISEKE
jgi:biotin carboxyl carrier protein